MPVIDPVRRRVELSVSEFADFRQRIGTIRSGTSAADPWRMRRGQAWHRAEHAALAESGKDGDSEHAVTARWQHEAWLFIFRGRVDQIEFPAQGVCLIREIKTVGCALPQTEQSLRESHASYFNQLASYMVLTSVMPATADCKIDGELLFIEPGSGIRQCCPLNQAEARSLFDQQLKQWLKLLNSRERSMRRRQSLHINPAFEQWRDGQEAVLNQLNAQVADPRPLLLEAPTGFGKTGVVLQHALQALQEQRFERVIYLTGKSTGQLETLRQLREMSADGLLILPMRNRREHAEGCFCKGGGDPRICKEACGLYQADAQAHTAEPEAFFNAGVFDVQAAREHGNRLRLCPYALTRSLLPFADVWIGDFNYVFAPSGKAVFADCAGFQAEQTLLIIDEAHNLPERTASALELQLDSFQLANAVDNANEVGARWQDRGTLPALENWLAAVKANEGLSLGELYEWIDLLEQACDCLERSAVPWSELDPDAAECLGSLPQWLSRLEGNPLDWRCWGPTSGTVRLTCLDPASQIASAVKPFAKTLLMSATLQAYEDFAKACGFADEDWLQIEGCAPWRKGAYRVAIDRRVDTRLKSRPKHYARTAETLIACCTVNARPPVAAFFPSYRYAEAVREYIAVLDPALRVALQSRGETLAGQAEFIETALLMADVMFLILGSGFSEGIDQLGGRVERIVVVGPSLPEVNPIQQAKMQRLIDLGSSREQAFNQIYRIAGMRKIRQALGRVVRAPGQQADVLLHCQRFAEAEYRELLNPDYASDLIINSDLALLNWLRVARANGD